MQICKKNIENMQLLCKYFYIKFKSKYANKIINNTIFVKNVINKNIAIKKIQLKT